MHNDQAVGNDTAVNEDEQSVNTHDTLITGNLNDRENTFTRFELLSLQNVKKLILSGNSKSCNLDPIPTKLLKEHLDLLLYTVYNIINGSLQSGVL